MMRNIFIGAFIFCNFLSGASTQAQGKLYPNTFHLGDVKPLDGPFKKAMDLNIKTLLKYDINRLLSIQKPKLVPNDLATVFKIYL